MDYGLWMEHHTLMSTNVQWPMFMIRDAHGGGDCDNADANNPTCSTGTGWQVVWKRQLQQVQAGSEDVPISIDCFLCFVLMMVELMSDRDDHSTEFYCGIITLNNPFLPTDLFMMVSLLWPLWHVMTAMTCQRGHSLQATEPECQP